MKATVWPTPSLNEIGETPTSSADPRYTSTAESSGWPRLMRFTTKAYPERVISPGFHSRASSSVSASCQATSCLPLGSEKPPATNADLARSNSRKLTASSPPSDKLTMQRCCSGSRQTAPFQNQLAFSDVDNASRSMTVPQFG